VRERERERDECDKGNHKTARNQSSVTLILNTNFRPKKNWDKNTKRKKGKKGLNEEDLNTQKNPLKNMNS
jgi:hypothetical protein